MTSTPSHKLLNVVLDLETLSLKENAAIIQIGCCVPKFDRHYLKDCGFYAFETTIAYEECLKKVQEGVFDLDSETMQWWEGQQEARKIVFSGQSTYVQALDQLTKVFNVWRKESGLDIAVWGNGADFDNKILAHTLSALGYPPLWNYKNNRCFRTLKAVYPTEDTEAQKGRILHTAVDDAKEEADKLDEIKWSYFYGNSNF